MANRFLTGVARLQQHMLNYAAVSIIYHKVEGVVDTAIPLTVWVGNTLFKITDKNGQRMEWGDRDYLIAVATLLDGVVPFLPAKGHYIVEAVNGIVTTYELSAPENEPVWRYSDPQHTIYRLHTKKVVIVP